jgi:hypothetical protein
MSVPVSVISTQAAPIASSGFSWGDAAVIFVVVIVGLLVLVGFVGRRTRRLSYRPRLRTEHDQEIREAAEEDIEAVEDDSWVTRRDIPGSREDDL